MNKRDRARWAACATMADIGECMADWLAGEISMCPTYQGGPHGETRRHLSVMCGLNRNGFITEAMNDEAPYAAYVSGFVRTGAVPRLYVAARLHGIEVHETAGRIKRETSGYYSGYVQDSAVAALRRCRMVVVEDPKAGRYGRKSQLWPALRQFARR